MTYHSYQWENKTLSSLHIYIISNNIINCINFVKFQNSLRKFINGNNKFASWWGNKKKMWPDSQYTWLFYSNVATFFFCTDFNSESNQFSHTLCTDSFSWVSLTALDKHNSMIIITLSFGFKVENLLSNIYIYAFITMRNWNESRQIFPLSHFEWKQRKTTRRRNIINATRSQQK